MEPPSPDPATAFLFILLAVDPTVILLFVVIALLLIISALVSGSEVAYFSLSPADLDELRSTNDAADQRVIKLLNDPERLLATILIANNLVNVAIIILTSMMLGLLIDFEAMSELAEFLINIVLVTFLILMAGEILPKVYATSQGLLLARVMGAPLSLLSRLFKPFSTALMAFSTLSSRLVKEPGQLSVDSLGQALELTMEDADADEQRILEGIVKFGNTDVKQVMTPRTSVNAIDIEWDFEELISKVIDYGHSRIPVYDDSLDRIKGLLYLKDLLPFIGIKKVDWQGMIREPFFVPESKKIDDLLIEFKEMKVHLAIVVDEYGGTSGIITLEDVIEEIVGDITDEFDDEDIRYSRISDTEYLIEGRTPLIDVYRIMGIEGDEIEQAKGESDTLAGFIIEIAGKIPLKNEKIHFSDITFTVEAADKRKVRQVKVSLNPAEEDTDEN